MRLMIIKYVMGMGCLGLSLMLVGTAQAGLLISEEAGVVVVRGDVEEVKHHVDTSRHGVHMVLPRDFRGTTFDKPLLLVDGSYARRERRVYSGRKCRC